MFNKIKAMQKTTKSKSGNSSEKVSTAVKTEAKSRKTPMGNYTPSEDEIREKAKEIYHQRILRGEHGTAVEDWNNAEKLLKSQGR
jgi:hypothetical protein